MGQVITFNPRITHAPVAPPHTARPAMLSEAEARRRIHELMAESVPKPIEGMAGKECHAPEEVAEKLRSIMAVLQSALADLERMGHH